MSNTATAVATVAIHNDLVFDAPRADITAVAKIAKSLRYYGANAAKCAPVRFENVNRSLVAIVAAPSCVVAFETHGYATGGSAYVGEELLTMGLAKKGRKGEQVYFNLGKFTVSGVETEVRLFSDAPFFDRTVTKTELGSLPREEFIAALRAAVAHASRDTARPHLCTVALEYGPAMGVRLVATDGHRIIRCEVEPSVAPFDRGVRTDKPYLLPAPEASVLADALDVSTSKHVRVLLGKEHLADKRVLTFETLDVDVSIWLFEGNFPDSNQVMYQQAETGYTEARFDAKALRSALKPFVAGSKLHGVTIDCLPHSTQAIIEQDNGDTKKKAYAELFVAGDTPKRRVVLGINPWYVCEMLEAMGDERVRMSIANPSKESGNDLSTLDPVHLRTGTMHGLIMSMRV